MSAELFAEQHPAPSSLLDLTAEGAHFVTGLMAARRRLIDNVTFRMSVEAERALAQGLEAFLAPIEAAPADESIGLPGGRTIPWLMSPLRGVLLLDARFLVDPLPVAH